MKKSLLIIFIAAGAILNLYFIYAVLVCRQNHLYLENNLIENMQAGFFAVSFAIFLTAVFFRKNSLDRFILLFLSAICLTFFLREVDVERLDLPQFIILIGSGMGRNLILAAVYVLLLALGKKHITSILRNFKKFFSSKVIAVFAVAIAVLFLGDKIGTMHKIYPTAEFLEELIELNGAALVLLSAFIAVPPKQHIAPAE